MIASTTDAAWNDRLAGDSMVREHTHRMRVPEPTADETVSILEVHRPGWSMTTASRSPDAALPAAATMAKRYVAGIPAARRPRWLCCTGRARCSSWRGSHTQAAAADVKAQAADTTARRRRCGRGRERDDLHPGEQAGGGRARPLCAHGGCAARTHHRPGGGGAGGEPRGEDRPRGVEGPRSGPSAPSCSWALPASARRSWRRRWPSSCSATRTRWWCST